MEEAPAAPTETKAIEDDDVNKRRKLLQEALELDKDDDSEDEKEAGMGENGTKASQSGDENEYVVEMSSGYKRQLINHDSDDEDDDDEEDDTAELLRELAKIKQERAEEKERLEREQNTSAQQAREEEIATANPLLNLAAALGQQTGVNTTAPGTFAVKRRWDDGTDIILSKKLSVADCRCQI